MYIKNILSYIRSIHDIKKILEVITDKTLIHKYCKTNTLTINSIYDLEVTKELNLSYVHTLKFNWILDWNELKQILNITKKGKKLILKFYWKGDSWCSILKIINYFDFFELHVYQYPGTLTKKIILDLVLNVCREKNCLIIFYNGYIVLEHLKDHITIVKSPDINTNYIGVNLCFINIWNENLLHTIQKNITFL